MFKRGGDSQSGPLSVALIGCGPAGMMLLHALAHKTKTLDPDSKEFKNLPKITCYEQASSSGGVWKTASKGLEPRDDVAMYDDLWCNTPKEMMELSDYTWDDHFKKQTPTFLPRKDVLDYLIARNSVDGALDEVKFKHCVQMVKYESNKFVITVADSVSGITKKETFDRCVWAAGLNAEPEKPSELLEMLEEFTGKVIHSSEARETFGDDVKGKRVMIIGDSSSAEDLALLAVKLGVEKVYICARTGEGAAYSTGCWPNKKVTALFGLPYKVVKGNGFKVQAVYWSEKRQKFRRDDDEETVKVKDIDTVILATGYDYDLDMVDDSLKFDPDCKWQASKGWMMDNNALTISLGNVDPSAHLDIGATCYPDVYRCLLVSNPNMMYLTETEDTETPLIDLDVAAWLTLSYLTGQTSIPKEKEMIKSNQKQLEAEMQIPFLRLAVDPVYADEIDELGDDHWSENPNDERSIILGRQAAVFKAERLARDMKTCGYPVDFGKASKLSSTGEKFVELLTLNEKTRTSLNKESGDSKWRTFRDTDPTLFTSLYTGTASVPLPDVWLKLESTHSFTG